MERKSFQVSELKALGEGDEAGTFEAVVAVFGNVDRGGDRIEKGAFARTLDEKGYPPLVWSHNWDIPPIGVVQEASETDEGLLIKGRLFVGEGEDHPVARQVYAAMTAQDGNGQAPLKEFSFGYEVKSSSEETEDGTEIRILKDLDLFEVGPTLVGMNPSTRLVAAKGFHEYADQLAQAAKAAAETNDEPPDNPDPNDTQVSEEDRARIAGLVAQQPAH